MEYGNAPGHVMYRYVKQFCSMDIYKLRKPKITINHKTPVYVE